MKTNQDGGSYSAKKPSAPGKERARNQAKEGAGKAMGYSQNFGPGRASGYDKGALRAMDVMTHGGASKYMGEGPGQGFFSKLGRTISRGASDIGTQLLDMVQPDIQHINRPHIWTNSANKAVSAKQKENAHYDKSRALAKGGQTFGTIADYLDDDGKGNARTTKNTNQRGR
jgi:hypothetical protein